jgi:hypothetical protein
VFKNNIVVGKKNEQQHDDVVKLKLLNPFQSNFSVYFGQERGWWIACN